MASKFLRRSWSNASVKCLKLRAISSNAKNPKIVKSRAPFLDLPKGNIVKNIFANAEKWWTKPAIECSETGQKFTYSELVEQTSRWSGFLKQIGVSKGDIITLIAPNCMQFPPIFYGTTAIGAALSPINATYTSGEIQRMLAITESKIVIYSNNIELTIAAALQGNSKDYQLFSIGKSKDLKSQSVGEILYGTQQVQPVAPEEIDGSEILYIPFSSGTTGLPKAVALSHNSILANTLQISNPYHELFKFSAGDAQDVQLAMFPFFHIYGSFLILTTGCFYGAKTIVVPKFTPQNFLNGVIKHKVSWLHTVPTLLNLLNNSPECNSETMSNVHSVICGAAPVLQPSVDMFRKKVKRETAFLEIYGMTEALITNLKPRKFQYVGGCGQLLSNVESMVINTETGEPLGPNQSGEICVKTPSAMTGYMNNPDATKTTIQDGWIHTGDIGYYDDDHFFHIVDRIKDLIKVQGMQVSPSEIEEELQKHPSVAECSVIGIPDKKSGELPFAFVILKEKTSEKDLQSFLQKKLSKHKQLRGGIRFVDSFPKSETGKILRRELRVMASS